ncbi:MAG: hydrolase [Ignavibacteriae bacterium]|jgi:predicted amidohydrolase|nr:hydrolase [Ignavibacteriota bacterium]NOG99614.1 hydrolase [Ignavibacteriota bacterium]
MKIGLFQYSPEWENPEANIAKINDILDNEISDEEMIVFPEMTLTGFTMNSEKFAEELDGKSTRFFMDLARQTKKHIFAGIIERDNFDIYNTLVHFNNQGLITARYRKIHPFSFADEHKYYSAGRDIFITKIEKCAIGLSVCYDLRFPELYRLYAKEKVDLIIDIANWPLKRVEHWKYLLKARAIENQCFVVGVNRVGEDPFNEYNGCSAVFSPMGDEIIMVADKAGLIKTELNLADVEAVRTRLPFLHDIKLI